MSASPSHFSCGARLVVLFAAVLTMHGCANVSTKDVEARLASMALQPNMYVVQAGDTLDTVAFRYKLAPAELAALNPGIQQQLRAGERINVRPGTQLSADLRAGAYIASNARAQDVVAPSVSQGVTVTAVVPQSSAIPANAISAPAGAFAISEAMFDPVTGGHPGEVVVPDDLDLIAPSNGYTPVPAADQAAASPSMWVWPTDGQVARGFAPERIGGQGVDIAGVPGQNVLAATDGTVVYSGKDPSGSGGSLVILQHSDGLMTTYSHADKLFVTEDDIVQAGDPIASLGWNEASESVLSFEVRRGGAPLDPMSFVTAR